MVDRQSDQGIQAPAAAFILGVSVRQVQNMAARGLLPSAAKIGSVWTFRRGAILGYRRQKEGEACQRAANVISIGGTASGTVVSVCVAETLDEAYERALGGSPGGGSRN